jgi:hypothetical protein
LLSSFVNKKTMLRGFMQNNAGTKKPGARRQAKHAPDSSMGITELDETSARQTSMGVQSSMKQVPHRA